MEKFFLTEQKTLISPDSFKFLRAFYLPVVGPAATTLYSLLVDFHALNNAIRTFEPLSYITKVMQVSPAELELLFRKLEAVGLIRRFESADERSYIISVLSPLNAAGLRQNSFLYREVVSRTGDILFERLEFAFKDFVADKSDYHEVTTKFQDLFPVSLPSSSTLEVPLAKISNLDEAIKVLSPMQLIAYLSSARATPTQLQAVQRAQQCGFSNPSINLVINYVYNRNSRFISAHFETIINDFFNKKITGFLEIASELSAADLQTKRGQVKLSATEAFSAPAAASSASEMDSWDEIFKSLSGEVS